MKYSRRHLLRVAPAAFAAAALPRVRAAEWDAKNGLLTREKMMSVVNDAFLVQLDKGISRWFTLLSVEDTSERPAYRPALIIPRNLKIPVPRKLESFALNFQNSGDPLPQGTYVFQHRSLGDIPLFIVPAGKFSYIAIVNRLAAE